MIDFKNDFYGANSGATEIDMRQEFLNTMFGAGVEIPKGQNAAIRVFRKDANDKKIRCACVDPVTDESPREARCPYCLGEKYLWDESLTTLYWTDVEGESSRSDRESLRQPGRMNTPLKVFYLDYSENLTDDDKIVILNLDKEGNLVTPYTRLNIYRIAALRPVRLDNGRLEFWKANGYEDNIKHL